MVCFCGHFVELVLNHTWIDVLANNWFQKGHALS